MDDGLELAARGRYASPAMAFLHDEGGDDWQKWFTQTKSSRGDCAAGLNFSDPAIMLQAATSGHGVCLGPAVLAGSYLANGTLVRAAETPLQTKRRYYLSAWKRSFARSSVQALWGIAHLRRKPSF